MTELYEVVVKAMNLVENISGHKKEQAIHIVGLHIDKLNVSEQYKSDLKRTIPYLIEMVVWASKNKKEIKINATKCASKFSCVNV